MVIHERSSKGFALLALAIGWFRPGEPNFLAHRAPRTELGRFGPIQV